MLQNDVLKYVMHLQIKKSNVESKHALDKKLESLFDSSAMTGTM